MAATHRRAGLRLDGVRYDFDTAPERGVGGKGAYGLRDRGTGQRCRRITLVERPNGRWRVRLFESVPEPEVKIPTLARFHGQTSMRVRVSEMRKAEDSPIHGVQLVGIRSAVYDTVDEGRTGRLTIVANGVRNMSAKEKRRESRSGGED